ncbi:cardiolipin synthase [Paracoccus sp. S-4012]|nr:cardiolipin synthase [Paracoccus sp. S-4012]
MWPSFLGFLHFAAALLVVIRVLLKRRMSPPARLAWILLIEVLPVVGITAYLLFGEVRMRRAERQRMADVRNQLTGVWQRAPETVAAVPAYAEPVVASIEAGGGMEPVRGNRITLLEESDLAIARLVAALDAAEEEIHLLFYIWLPDHSGTQVAEAVIRARGRGIAVRLIVDALGSRLLVRSALWGRMQAAGAECVRAFPWGNPLVSMLFQRLDLRNHRKIVVIDDRLAFTGSRNCADMAFAIKPRYAPWIDVLMAVEGPVVRQLQAVFLQDWMSYTGQDHGDELKAVPAADTPGEIAQVLATGPDLRQERLPDSIATLIHASRSSVTITTPYYVPDEAIDNAIRSAARRGVRVTLILPERNDSRIVSATSEGYFRELLRAGVRLMLFRGGLLHAKIVTVDGRMSLSGSANLDRRSFDLNYEVNLFVIDEEFTAVLDHRQQSYIERARRLTLEDVEGWTRLRRIRNNLLAIAAPLL